MDIIIRLSGEITIKSTKVSRQFQSRLATNIRSAFSENNLEGKVKQEWSRIYVFNTDPKACKILKNIFGVKTFSVIDESCSDDLNEIVELGSKLYSSKVADKTFAVKVRRNGRHSYSSMDVQKELGGRLKAAGGIVQLNNPEITVSIDIRDDRSLFYSEIQKGPGGLPLGTGGHGICLMSGGFDSPVAAWMIQKRGVTLDYLLCNLAGDAYERSVLSIAQELSKNWCYGTKPNFYIIDFEKVTKDLKEKVKPKFAQIVLKRLFYKAGEKLASITNSQALVTGEAIGQVSSQTLANLKAIDSATGLPVMRPLISFDKEEIISISRKVGTHNKSANVQEFCQLVQDKPSTACKQDVAEFEESLLDSSILDEAFEKIKKISLKEVNEQQLASSYLITEKIPADAVIIDCRSIKEFNEQHYSDALHKEYYELIDDFTSLTKKSTYILYCAVGMQSTVIAEKMQKEGYLAYSYKGGAKSLLANEKK